MRTCETKAALLAVAVTLLSGTANATTRAWNHAGTDNWNVSTRWDPNGVPVSGDVCTNSLSSGVIRIQGTITPFPGALYLVGTGGVGGTLRLGQGNATYAVSETLYLAGGRLYMDLTQSSASYSGTIIAVGGTTSIVEVAASYGMTSFGGTLSGSGTINKVGSYSWPLSNDATLNKSGFTGRINVNAGMLVNGATSTSGFTLTQGQIWLNSGGSFSQGDTGASTTLNKLFLNGGTFGDHGNNTCTYAAASTCTVVTASAILVDGSGTGNRACLAFNGKLTGSANLTVTDGTSNADGKAFRLGNANNDYSGHIDLYSRDASNAGSIVLTVPGAMGTASLTLRNANTGLLMDTTGTPSWTLDKNDVGGIGWVRVEDGAGSRVLTFKGGRTLAPGLSTGTLTLRGSLTLGDATTAGNLSVELGGTGAGQFDVLDLTPLTGSPTLTLTKGVLDISLTGGFKPQQTDSFKIVNVAGANSVVGKFSATNAPAPYKVKVAYNGGDNNDVVLQIWTNAPPHADNMVVQATKDTPKPFALQGTDANGDPLTFEFTTPTAQGGTVALQGGEPAGSSNVVYNPPAGFTGWDTFTFRANDGEFNSGWAIVSNQVVGGNNPPTVTVPASADPNPVAGSQTALSVAGDDDFGAGNLTFTWSTTNTPPEPVGYSDNGTTSASNTTATFTKAGFYGFRVVMQDTGGLSATSGVDVVVDQTLTSISLTPLTTLVRTNMTRQFAAAAVDQFADPMSVPYAWSVSGGGTIDGTGLFTATTVGGPFTVQAVSASVTGLATVASVYAGVVDVGGNNSAARPATWAGLADALADATLYVASGNVLVRLSSYDGAGGPANYKRQASEVNTKRLIVSNTNAAARLTIEGGYSQDFSSTSGQTTVDGNMNTDVNPGGTITTTTASTPEAARVFTLTGAGQIVMRNLDVTGGGRTTGDTTVLVGGGINVAAKARLSGLTVRHCMNVNGGGGGIYTDSGSGGSVFENLVIRGNKTVGGTAAGGGFRVYTPSGTLLVANCVFRDNRAADVTYSSGGSHLYKGNEAATVVFGSVFYDAYSSNYGALNDSNTGASVPLLIVNSTVANNPQLAYYQDRMNSSVRVRNCISADNGSTGQGINFASGTKAMGRTLFDDDTVSGSFTDEGGNVGTDGSAHDPEFRDQGNRDYRLTAASAEAIDKGGYLGTASVAFANGTATVKFVDVNNSGVGAYQALTDVIVDVGGFAGLTEADYEAHFIYTTDIAGNPRLSDGDRAGGAAIDMGAYEFPTPAPSGMILIVR